VARIRSAEQVPIQRLQHAVRSLQFNAQNEIVAVIGDQELRLTTPVAVTKVCHFALASKRFVEPRRKVVDGTG
jgi:hypothetical protein